MIRTMENKWLHLVEAKEFADIEIKFQNGPSLIINRSHLTPHELIVYYNKIDTGAIKNSEYEYKKYIKLDISEK